jgi:hypothetical protein
VGQDRRARGVGEREHRRQQSGKLGVFKALQADDPAWSLKRPRL